MALPQVQKGDSSQCASLEGEGPHLRKTSHEEGAPEGCVLEVTGHSLGGALAALAAVDMSKEFREIPLHVYSFGAPRTGNMLS